jgi:hypothetical protein
MRRMSLTTALLGLICSGGTASAAQCEDKSTARAGANSGVTVALHAEWAGVTQAEANLFEQIVTEDLTANDTFFICTIDKVLFPPLGTVRLFDVNSVRAMIKDPSQIGSDPATFEQKLKNYDIKYLLMVKAEFSGKSGTLRFNAVRIDPSGGYPAEGFDRGFTMFDSFDDAKASALREKMAAGLTRLKSEDIAPYPIMVACFIDQTSNAEPTWQMEILTDYIPKQLAQKLMQEKSYFPKSYPLYSGGCPFTGVNSELITDLSSKYGKEHWFVWTGRMYYRGLDLQVEIGFVHRVNQLPLDRYEAWAPPSPSRKINPWEIHEKMAPLIIAKWEEYLKNNISPRRPVPLP